MSATQSGVSGLTVVAWTGGPGKPTGEGVPMMYSMSSGAPGLTL